MAKIKIILNSKEYLIDESILSSASNELKEHMSTVMNGSGAVINLDGVPYNIDITKLSTATNNFVSHLGTIAGSGSKVTVGGTEYGIDSTKLTCAISDLEAFLGGTDEERLEGDGAEYYTLAPSALSFRSTAPLNELQEVQINGVTVDPSNYILEEGSTIVTFPIHYLKTLNVGNYEVTVASESKSVSGSFTVAAPSLNEYGFYYNQPYYAYVSYFGSGLVIFIRDNGTLDSIFMDGRTDTCDYVVNGNNMVVTSNSLGELHCTISDNGMEIYLAELDTTFALGEESVVADNDYLYAYREDLGGYEVTAIDKTKSSYNAIKTGINGIDTVKLADYAFAGNVNLVDFPIMADTIRIIGECAFANCVSLQFVDFPLHLDYIGYQAFYRCESIENIYIPHVTTYIAYGAFCYCNSLLTVWIPKFVTRMGSNAFGNCSSLNYINYGGTAQQWKAIDKPDDWGSDIPATYVQCSDGQVAL